MDGNNEDLSYESNMKRLKAHNAFVDKMIEHGVIPRGEASSYLRDCFWWRGHIPMQIEQLLKKDVK